MGVRRGYISIDHDFTITPNAWSRDNTLSYRARGILLMILSHRQGWEMSLDYIAREGKEGITAVRAAIKELESAGYLVREQSRSNMGTFAESDYVLCDPAEQGTDVRKTDDGSSDIGQTDIGSPHTKEYYSKEDYLEENYLPADAGSENEPTKTRRKKKPTQAQRRRIYAADFEDWYQRYPRHESKADASKAYANAILKIDPPALVAALEKQLPAMREKITRDGTTEYIKLPGTWLRNECWSDETMLPVGDEQPKVPYGWTPSPEDFDKLLGRQ